MMIPCNYHVNVSKLSKQGMGLYVHYCKIELGDCLRDTAVREYKDICKRFPVEEQFKCDLYYVECKAEHIKIQGESK